MIRAGGSKRLGAALSHRPTIAAAWISSGDRQIACRGRGPDCFCLQSACLWFSASRTELYAFALAMHYVEYHLLMAPRCFATQLDPTSRVDRLFGLVRGHKLLAYGLLLAAAGLVTHFAWLGLG